MAKYRATKKQYTGLFDNPRALFPGAEVRLWPFGQPEIWIRDSKSGRGVRIRRAGGGPAGFGLEISTFMLSGGADLALQYEDVNQTPHFLAGVRSLEVVQHYPDARSQTYRTWYRSEGGYPCDVCGTPDPTYGQTLANGEMGGSFPYCGDDHREELERRKAAERAAEDAAWDAKVAASRSRAAEMQRQYDESNGEPNGAA